jgi:hypothetical protein
MITKIAILDPRNGQFTYVDNLEEAQEIHAKQAFEMYMNYIGKCFYAKVEIDENGWEKWTTKEDYGTELPKHYIEKLKEKLNNENL